MHIIENIKSNIKYEIINKPFFGSLSNAELSLKKVSRKAIDCTDFINLLEKSYHKFIDKIELVQFYDFEWTFNNRYERGFNFKIAIIHTMPDAKFRDKLFAERDRITINTGWYPYIMGSRANINTTLHRYYRAINHIPANKMEPLQLGKPNSIIDVSNNKSVNAILLCCTYGSILFDTGFGVDLPDNSDLKAICISHFHKDHCGGLYELLERRDIPVLMSETTLEYILALKEVLDGDKLALIKNVVVLEKVAYGKIFRKYFDFFPVFHCPGAFGFVYKGYNGCSIYYLGDVCLKNGFMQFQKVIDQMIKEDENSKKYVIMDAALVGKNNFTVDSDDIPVVLLQDTVDLVRKRDVVFISNSIEILMYSYILFFMKSNIKNIGSIKLTINDDLYDIVKTLWASVILKHRRATIDAFVKNVLQGGRCNFVESQRVYPISALDTVDRNENIASFITVKEIDDNQLLRDRINGADVVLVGHWTIKASIPETIAKLQPRSVLRVSSPEWSFHSSEEDISRAIYEWSDCGVNTVLFHNYSKVLRKFILPFDGKANYICEQIVLED